MTPDDWTEWRASCARLAKFHHEKGARYHHAGSALDRIAISRILYDDVPLADMKLRMLSDVVGALRGVPEKYYVRMYRAQFEHWFCVWSGRGNDCWSSDRILVSDANGMAARHELRHWIDDVVSAREARLAARAAEPDA